jgi:energy-coupling factor transport system permease protein
MMTAHWAGYVAAAAFLLMLVRLARVPLRLLLRGLRPVLFILVFAATINLFLTPGTEEIFRWGFLRITREGAELAVQMALRLSLLVAGSSVLTLTTSPIQLTDGIEFLLAPLKKIRVPAHAIAMMMTIALRNIPVLAEEMDKIVKAQKARGADFETGNVFRRAKALVPVLVPLFVGAFKRADGLAIAMEARCYRGGKGRTKLSPLKMRSPDWLILLTILLLNTGLILTRLL